MRLFDCRENNSRATVDTSIATFELWPFGDASDLFEQDGAFGMIADWDFFQVFNDNSRLWPQATEHTNGTLDFTRNSKTTTGVYVAFSQCLSDLLDCDVVFQ